MKIPPKSVRLVAALMLFSAAWVFTSARHAPQEACGCGASFFATTARAADATPLPSSLPLLVDLGASQCIPCKMMAPILEELKKEYAGRLQVEFLDVRKTPDAAKKYKINLIPTQIFFDAAGKELFRHEGFFAKKEILAKWKELGLDFDEKKEAR